MKPELIAGIKSLLYTVAGLGIVAYALFAPDMDPNIRWVAVGIGGAAAGLELGHAGASKVMKKK